MHKTAIGPSCPGAILRSFHTEKSYLGKVGYPVLYNDVTAPGQRKTHVKSYRRQTVYRGKVDHGVSELTRGNDLSRDHVNSP